jgi:hypothetical protein
MAARAHNDPDARCLVAEGRGMMRLGFTALIVLAGSAAAAEEGEGDVNVAPNMRMMAGDSAEAKKFNAAQQKMAGRAVMVSLLRDGKVVVQREVQIQEGEPAFPVNVTFEKVKAGRYDLRIEGEGVETVVKKGLHVAAKRELKIFADLLAGKGTRVIEYGKDGDLAAELEKVRKRIKQLEEAGKGGKK